MSTDDAPTDWTTDYDIFDPRSSATRIRHGRPSAQSECPVAHTERWGGSWMPTRYDDIVAVAQEHDVFTSRNILVVLADGPDRGAVLRVSPHRRSRRTRQSTTGTDALILPIFAPQAVAKYEEGTRACATN